MLNRGNSNAHLQSMANLSQITKDSASISATPKIKQVGFGSSAGKGDEKGLGVAKN